jgi:hypothetical protein
MSIPSKVSRPSPCTNFGLRRYRALRFSQGIDYEQCRTGVARFSGSDRVVMGIRLVAGARGWVEERSVASLHSGQGCFHERQGSQSDDRLNYAERLRQGQAIGSGQMEGKAKTLGMRLKARGTRWKRGNVQQMASVVCLRSSTQWDAYWIANLAA